jgi:hypothetical protein
MVYPAGWAAIYFALILHSLTGYRGRFFVFVLLGYFAVLAFLRGNVGTDTASYERMLASFVGGYAWDGREPGFIALGVLLESMAPTTEFAVRAIALVFFALLAVFVIKSNRNERFLLLAYVFPAFAYQYSMNALRIGLASAVLLLALQSLRQRGGASALRVGLTATLFHYSTAFSVLYLVISQRPWMRVYSTFGMLGLLVLFSGGFLLADFYFMEKMSAYEAMQAPGPFSGLSKILPVLLILVGVGFGILPPIEKAKLTVLGISFLFVGWLITQFSYAGLRLIDLVAFVAPLSVLATYARLGLEFDLRLRCAIVLAGAISAAGVYRGFLLGRGEGITPFLPYEIGLGYL